MSQLGSIIIAVILSIVVVAPLSWSLAIAHRKKSYEDKIGSAEIKSREIIEEALKTAETKKREALLEAKEESIKTKNELDREVKERRAELARYEKRVLSKEENLDKKQDLLKRKKRVFLQERKRYSQGARKLNPCMIRESPSLRKYPDSQVNKLRNFCYNQLKMK